MDRSAYLQEPFKLWANVRKVINSTLLFIGRFPNGIKPRGIKVLLSQSNMSAWQAPPPQYEGIKLADAGHSWLAHYCEIIHEKKLTRFAGATRKKMNISGQLET